MKRAVSILAIVCVCAGFYWIARAGDLEPPGPPAPTMKTLDEVESRVAIRQSDFGPTGFEISESGSYYFLENVTVPGDGIQVTTTAIAVTLDLNGFTLAGADVGVGIRATGTTFAIQNGTVRDFSTGVASRSPGHDQARRLSHQINRSTDPDWRPED